MEEGDKEVMEEEFENEDDYGIENLEDLKSKEEIDEEEKIEKERKRKLIPKKHRRKGDVLDYNYPEIYLNDSQVVKETSYVYCTATVAIKPSQRNLICFVQQHSGMKDRSSFIRHALLVYCRNYMKLVQVKREVDLKFQEDYKKLLHEELMEKNNVKERLKKMGSSQDGGGDPFTVDDLME